MTATMNEDARQFEIRTDDGLAFLQYERSGNRIAIRHTEVPESMGGKGIGGQLARSALEYARDNGLRAVVFCPFVQSYVKRHPEFDGLIDQQDEWQDEAGPACRI